MTPFEELTRLGRARRLATLARSVLDTEFGLTNARVRLVATHSFNTVFRVDTSGLRAALRVGGAARIHPVGVEDVEAEWLDVLAANDVTAPRNLPTCDGRRWTIARDSLVSGERVCSLFSWVDGVELRKRLTRDGIGDAGRLLARLHRLAHAAPITTFPELHADRAVYFTGQDLVSTTRHPDQALFVEAIDRVQRAIDALWQSPEQPHLLHGDFGPHNILSMRGRLRPIDFQDLAVGFRSQELGLTIADLGRLDPSLIEPFARGYAEEEVLPELTPNSLALFAAGRSLNIMNLALYAPDTGIGTLFDSHAERVRTWMLTTS